MKNYAHHTLYRSCLPIYEIAIILFLDDFEGNANGSVAIKSSFTVFTANAIISMLFSPAVYIQAVGVYIMGRKMKRGDHEGGGEKSKEREIAIKREMSEGTEKLTNTSI